MLADMLNFRADIYAGERKVLVRHYQAADTTEALETARQDVVATGNDHADVYQGDELGGAAYLETVGAEQ